MALSVCSFVRRTAVKCRSEFSKPDDDTDVWYVDDTNVGADDGQCDIAESGADNESDVDVKRQRQ